MRIRYLPWLSLLAALGVAGCSTGLDSGCTPCPPVSEVRTLSVGCDDSGLPLQLDRGDWEVRQGTEVWKALEERPGARAVHRGYLVGRDYRQMRGGPVYRVYTVTTLRRDETIGRIDQVGRAWRFEPSRNAGFEQVSLGVGTLAESVGAILDTPYRIRLERTTERRILFEMLDVSGDGALQPEEIRNYGDRLRRADANDDGVVDFEEMDALDTL